jgi:hypothetical protein
MNFLFKSLLLSSLLSFSVFGQTTTVGLLNNSINTTQGYTLFTPEMNQNVYLIDNCGYKINEWQFTERPGATCYLLENGNLLRAGKDSLEIRDWDNNLIWSYAMNNNGFAQHHDIEPLPNGNILCVVTDNYTPTEMIEAGRDPNEIGVTFKLDKIIELMPVGSNDASIVWEWKFMDHLIQDIDNTKMNFGVVEDHPELIDINFYTANNSDWSHINAVDYNPELDQIIISSRNHSEFYIIDHSTSSIEAASHLGGNSGKGGDFLWRWGNPQVYRQGNADFQKLSGPHDSKFIFGDYDDAGKISVFNNGGDGTAIFSSIHLITPVIIGGAYAMQDGMFLPLDFDYSWSGEIQGETMFENKKCGTHVLPNGNFIVCQTSLGQISEINRLDGVVLWTYKNPNGTELTSQMSIVPSGDNTLFRGEKYPIDFIGFSGKDLIPGNLIENENEISENCAANNGLKSNETFNDITVVNPTVLNQIQFNQKLSNVQLTVSDLMGQILFEENAFNGSEIILNERESFYLVTLINENTKLVFKIINL